jgi:hypothetical protein
VKFVVVWEPDATRDIDLAWASATDQEGERLVAALELIQQKLTTDPYQAGESREYALERVFIAFPLTVSYRIDRSTSQVRAYAAVVWRTAWFLARVPPAPLKSARTTSSISAFRCRRWPASRSRARSRSIRSADCARSNDGAGEGYHCGCLKY